MRFPLPLLFSTLLLTACGGNDAAQTATDQGASPEASAYQEAESALAEGKDAETVGGLLLGNFEAVSDPATGSLNVGASQDYVRLAQALADKYPADTAAALPLYRAAEVVRAMNKPALAAEIYQTVYERYPTFSKSPESLFMLAFTYDEDLKNYEAARETYNNFLGKYPNHSFADDTEMLLRNLGKTSEEMLRELDAQ